MGNHTKVTVFILAGLTDDPQLKVVLSISLLLIYLLSVTGNLTIITLTLVDAHLKFPTCFFLQKFSISYNSCAVQLFFAFLLGASEFYLLAAMSYDRYVAICKPLHYTTIMNSKICTQLLLRPWLAGAFVIFPPLLLSLDLDFWASIIVDRFYCDATPLMQISCSDIQFIEMMGFISAVVTLMVTLVMVTISYTYNALTILRIPSNSQRKKAFSTCSSHMIVIALSYGSCIFMYLKPSFKQRIFLQGNCCAQYLHCSTFESFHLHLMKPTSGKKPS